MARPSRAPYIAVRTDVVKDESFAMLGDIAGYNRHEALGRMVALWSFCRDRGLDDAPEGCRGYAVSEALVRRFLGSRGVDAILGDGCAELALGERFGEGLIYLRGTSDTVEALRNLSRTAEAGGRARAASSRESSGRFTKGHAPQPASMDEYPAAGQPVTYAVATNDLAAVKIGFTRDFRRRLTSLQTPHHEPLAVLGLISDDVENTIHQRIAIHRRVGEWFTICDDVVSVLAEFGIQLTDDQRRATRATSVAPPVQPAAPSVPPSSFLLPSPSEKNSEPKARRQPGPSAQVITHWNKRFETAYGTRPNWNPSNQRMVDGLTKRFEPDEIRRRIDAAFDAPPQWPPGPYDFETFARHFDKFIRPQSRPGSPAGGGIRTILSREQRERMAQERTDEDQP